jgi:ribosomal protein S18 acetylase RimI-like enzyme
VESASQAGVVIRFAHDTDVPACKRIADAHRGDLGFLPRAVFVEAAKRKRLLVAETGEKHVVGFVRFNHRVRGPETALYDICVDRDHHRMGIGAALVSSLVAECRLLGRSSIMLRCPEGAAASAFYDRLGFLQSGLESGRQRRIVVWRIAIREPAWSS